MGPLATRNWDATRLYKQNKVRHHRARTFSRRPVPLLPMRSTTAREKAKIAAGAAAAVVATAVLFVVAMAFLLAR